MKRGYPIDSKPAGGRSGSPGVLSVRPLARHPRTGHRLSAGEDEVRPVAADGPAVRRDGPLEVGGAAELGIDARQMDLAVDQGPLQTPAPAPFETVLPGQKRPRLPETE